MDTPAPQWPMHGAEVRPWQQQQRGGTREDRMLTEVTVSIPPRIAGLDALPSRDTIVLAEHALQAVARADSAARTSGHALGRFMIRTESTASSKIELIEASGDDLARAIAGSRANARASSMVAAAEALQSLMLRAGSARAITLDDLLEAHRLLMQNDEHLGDRRWAGRVRQEQNWIGGSDYSPRGADHVPPPPDQVEEALADLLGYVDRPDLPALVQASIAHAQFESIHPFTDGNGRIGRALLGAVLQRRGATRNAVVPIASGLYALRTDYFAALNRYRDGDIDSIVRVIARAATVAAEESLLTFDRLLRLPTEWDTTVKARQDSAARRMLQRLIDHPVLTADDLIGFTGGSTAAAYAGILVLEEHGLLREVTGRKRDRVWVVADIVAELEDLDLRIRNRLA